MSGVVKEWECPEHGTFESTHPICPEIGCDLSIRQVFLTPPNIGSNFMRRFDKGIKQSVDTMKLGNLRTARAGEAAYGNQGNGMLWGEQVQKVLGVDVGTLVGAASKPLQVTHKDGRQETIEKSVMRELAGEGMTARRLPKPAELTGHRADREKPKNA